MLGGIPLELWLVIGGVIVVFGTFIAFATRYHRCPSDKILVKYGTVGRDAEGKGLSAECIHGGATFIWPILQDYGWLDLTPLTIDIDLTDALSAENIRISTPSTFTVGISTEPGVMQNAAERLLGLPLSEIKDLARDIIFGQMRVVIATMNIEPINSDRDQFIQNISANLEPELQKVGLRLINVNIKDVSDKSGFIEALGRKAAAREKNKAKRQVAQEKRDGEVGKAEAEREQRIEVAQADAEAVDGENQAEVEIANSNADRREAEAEANRRATAAEKVKQAQAKEESYEAQKEAEQKRAEREEASEYADKVVPAKVEKQRVETLAEADAEEERRKKQGEADGIYSVMQARAKGHREILSGKADGFRKIVDSTGGDARLASLVMITEQLPDLVEEQVKAISDLEFDSVTVWEGGSGSNGQTNTADFASGLIGAIPPLHEITRNAGVELPEYLGRIVDQSNGSSDQTSDGEESSDSPQQIDPEEITTDSEPDPEPVEQPEENPDNPDDKTS